AGVIAIFINNAVEGKTSYIYGDGLQTRDFIYVDDVVRALVSKMDDETVGTFNIGTGKESSLLEIVLAIEEALGHKIDIEFQPAKLGEERRSCLKTDLAKKVLDWQAQVELSDGIKRTIAWSKDNLN
ncbi:MAG TPA: GDP-mannose 4,6-dehydratase, partial [Patescibacteria group bacterium]|nr:GDP-mannose 4,6-dehydratase [Patescibacteria group bacterium]